MQQTNTESQRCVGITFSAFDLCHAGHVQMLMEAKSRCDYLIVGLHVDPSLERPQKNKPVQSVVERYIQLKANKYVDEVIPYCKESDLLDILKLYAIDVRIIGVEYEEVNFTGKDYCLTHGIEIYYNSRSHQFSSTELRQRLILSTITATNTNA